jgi:putative peptidoglycan lipid II flippase
MGIVFLPITIITFIESEDIVQIVFGGGAFALDAVKNGAMALKGYSICFVPYAVRHIFSRFQYGNKDTKSPTINSSISIGVNIILSIVLSKVLGIFGVTLASSAAEFLCAVLNYRAVKRNNDFLNFNHLIIRAPVILLGSIICIALSLLGGSWFLNYSPLSRFLLITIMAGGLYFITIGYTLYKLIKQKGTL